MDARQIATVRRFNRTVTQRIGALDDSFLARPRPLGQSRLLWEIGPDGSELRALRSTLELDSGYLTRLIAGLESAGLITTEPDAADARVRTVRLTAAGVAERHELNRLSDDQAASILTALTENQRAELVSAMQTVERLLTASTVRIEVTDPAHPDAVLCIARYFAELGDIFEGGFDPGITTPAGEDALRAPAGAFLVARLHGEPIGCVGVKFHADRLAEIKRLWISPAARGLGLGRRVLSEAEALAARHGSERVRLDTNRTLLAAIALYRASGYREIPAFNTEHYAHHWFEKLLERSTES
jgi:DNA-binding MarR family transcriptional regulator/GNAT superfamily N-acetyltransferase